MILAELEHRDYVGYYTIARQFSHLEFHGNENIVQTLNDISDIIEDSQSRKNEVKMNCLKEAWHENDQKLLNEMTLDLEKRCEAIGINYKKKLAEGNLPCANGFDEISFNF